MPTTITGADGVNQVAPNSIDFVDLKNTLFNGLLGNNGYIKIPVNNQGVNRELIVQWGVITTSAAGSTTFSWPINFPNAVFSGVITGHVSGGSIYVSSIHNMTLTGFNASTRSNAGANTSEVCCYIAIGY